MRKITILCLCLFSAVSSASARMSSVYSRGSGYGVRAEITVPDGANVALVRQLSPRVVLGVEAAVISQMSGWAAMADARYYFQDKAFTPFADLRAGYGLIGKTIDDKDVYGLTGGATVGLSWRRLDLGFGVTYDEWSKVKPAISLSYTLML